MEDKRGRERHDWRSQLRNSHRIASCSGEAEKIFPSLTTGYYESLIDQDTIPDDPVYKQISPDSRETSDSLFPQLDPLNEESQMPVPYLIHRYNSRAVLLTTNRCAVHCRFCLRKREWKNGTVPHTLNDDELETVVSYLKKHPAIREILISGGDPLILETSHLKRILLRITQIPSVRIIRIGTRIPVVMPMRIDAELADMLAEFNGLWVATHFNHPREVTDESLNACTQFIKRGIPVVNQTVLLKDINDNHDTLVSLFRQLAEARIKPLYLFHIDPVAGNAHFATGVEKGVELMRQFRHSLSSLETPVFAIDLPEGGGKVPLIPDYRRNGKYETIDGLLTEYPHLG